MDFNKEYFLNYLRNGGDMDTIGRDIADAINDARDAYEAEKAIAAKAAEQRKAEELLETKRAIAEDMICLIKEYGDLINPEVSDCLDDYTTEDLDSMIHTMDGLFATLVVAVKMKEAFANELAAAPVKPVAKPSVKVPKTDDEVLANFIKNLM